MVEFLFDVLLPLSSEEEAFKKALLPHFQTAFQLAADRNHVAVVRVLLRLLPPELPEVVLFGHSLQAGMRVTMASSQDDSSLAMAKTISANTVLLDWKKYAASKAEITKLLEEELRDRELDQCVVLMDYDAQHQGEMELRVGQVLDIVSQEDEDWWQGRDPLTKREGRFPASNVAFL